VTSAMPSLSTSSLKLAIGIPSFS